MAGRPGASLADQMAALQKRVDKREARRAADRHDRTVSNRGWGRMCAALMPAARAGRMMTCPGRAAEAVASQQGEATGDVSRTRAQLRAASLPPCLASPPMQLACVAPPKLALASPRPPSLCTPLQLGSDYDGMKSTYDDNARQVGGHAGGHLSSPTRAGAAFSVSQL